MLSQVGSVLLGIKPAINGGLKLANFSEQNAACFREGCIEAKP